MRHFSLELRDLDSGEHWRLAQVFYEGEAVYFILSETGAFMRLKDLSPEDRARVERDLIFNLSADEAQRVLA